ncbi:LysE family transporter [Dietzia aurantiaca]|uniref:LysE family translocator n=1 Tax=Dietzia aurantiaca TaxID=983873 RepID=UPI001E4E39E6|nr:LysE family transporter [Dietzia aurantiaca]MCD2264141.1 LysE family transporter [Dietzia aurantiaca]
MTAAAVTALFAVWVVAVISPGPDVVVVLQRSLTGRRQGVATAVGIVAGLSVWLVAAFAGVAALVRVYPQVMVALQVAGGLLLATLGVLGLRGWWRSRATPPAPAQPAPPAPSAPDLLPRADFMRGLLTNLANPKALVFFGAVLTPFLSGEVSVVASVGIVAGLIAVALAWFGGLALVASHRVVNERVGRLLPWVDLVASVLFVGVGVAFVVAALA